MCTRHVTSGAGYVCQLIIEEKVRFECFQHLRLIHSAQEESFVDLHAPAAQRRNDPLMRGRVAGSDDSYSDLSPFRRIFLAA